MPACSHNAQHRNTRLPRLLQVATGRTLSLEAREGIETLGPKQGITHGISARFGAAQQVSRDLHS